MCYSRKSVSVKAKYKISKVLKSIQRKNYEPIFYEVWEVNGPKNFYMEFISQKEARQYISEYCNTAYEKILYPHIK